MRHTNEEPGSQASVRPLRRCRRHPWRREDRLQFRGRRLPPPSRGAPVLAPLTVETFKIQFTASRALRDKLRQAQDLLRHRVPDGDLAAVLERALDLLIEDVKKERFAVGRKARQVPKEEVGSSRHIPDPIKRAVYERDGGCCTFADGGSDPLPRPAQVVCSAPERVDP